MNAQKSARLTLDFYFDFLSPFAYFAWHNMLALTQQYQLVLRPHPIVFGKLLDHWGQLGPAEIVPKREWVFKYCYRYASLNNIKFTPPTVHPFNPISALRLSLPQVSGDQQQSVISALYQAVWGEGRNLADPNELKAVINECGLNGSELLDNTQQTEIKDALKKSTGDAIERGVFGVPTTVVKNQLFWGNDQFDHIALAIEGKDPIDGVDLEFIKHMTRGIDRKKVSA